jgi:hypothetical protein
VEGGFTASAASSTAAAAVSVVVAGAVSEVAAVVAVMAAMVADSPQGVSANANAARRTADIETRLEI